LVPSIAFFSLQCPAFGGIGLHGLQCVRRFSPRALDAAFSSSAATGVAFSDEGDQLLVNYFEDYVYLYSMWGLYAYLYSMWGLPAKHFLGFVAWVVGSHWRAVVQLEAPATDLSVCLVLRHRALTCLSAWSRGSVCNLVVKWAIDWF
jgi:hypothetical protein